MNALIQHTILWKNTQFKKKTKDDHGKIEPIQQKKNVTSQQWGVIDCFSITIDRKVSYLLLKELQIEGFRYYEKLMKLKYLDKNGFI